MGAWTPLEGFARAPGAAGTVVARRGRGRRLLQVRGARRRQARGHGEVEPARRAQRGERAGRHRRRAARRECRCRNPSRRSAEFKGVKRRMELRGEVRGIAVYDDFAHHPTAIASTIDGLRRKVGAQAHRRGARAALGHHAHGRASRHAGAVARGGGCGVDVRAAGSRLGRRRGGGLARRQGPARALAR